MNKNREFKSDVFSMLMEDKKNALQVYNALNGSSYSDPDQVEILTLENGISLSVRNDAAFIIDMHLSIYEHQSTYNPNMPLRTLIYFSTVLQGMFKNRDLFSHHMIRIPTPHFAVFYNGTGNRPAREVLKLSASYAKPTEEPELELICTAYNINSGRDEEVLQKCNVLRDYTQFVEAVRSYEQKEIENPLEEAIDYCIEHDILADFLKQRRAEVLKAMTIDMTFERREVLIREEERIYGREEGRKEGREEGREEGKKEGREEMLVSLVRQNLLDPKVAMMQLGVTQEEWDAICKNRLP